MDLEQQRQALQVAYAAATERHQAAIGSLAALPAPKLPHADVAATPAATTLSSTPRWVVTTGIMCQGPREAAPAAAVGTDWAPSDTACMDGHDEGVGEGFAGARDGARASEEGIPLGRTSAEGEDGFVASLHSSKGARPHGHTSAVGAEGFIALLLNDWELDPAAAPPEAAEGEEEWEAFLEDLIADDDGQVGPATTAAAAASPEGYNVGACSDLGNDWSSPPLDGLGNFDDHPDYFQQCERQQQQRIHLVRGFSASAACRGSSAVAAADEELSSLVVPLSCIFPAQDTAAVSQSASSVLGVAASRPTCPTSVVVAAAAAGACNLEAHLEDMDILAAALEVNVP